MRPPIIAALIFPAAFLTLPALAQSPPPAAPAPPIASAPATAASGPPASLLQSLAGKDQIVGITENSGTRFLGRVISGDHGMYVVQTFHFAGPPKTTTRTVEAQPARQQPHTKTYTVGSGRNRQRIHVVTYSTVPGTKKRTERFQTDTTIPDDEAVRLLLRGVAGPTLRPREISDARQMLAAGDVKYLQALSPPAKKGDKSVAPFPGDPFLVSPSAASARPVWTMTMLWPTDVKFDNKGRQGEKKKGRRKSTPAPSAAL